MKDKRVFTNFIKNRDYSENKIEELKDILSINDKRLIRDTFKLLNSEIGYLDENKDYIFIIENCADFLNILCNNKDFTEEEILINRKRIKKSREALLAFYNKYKIEKLLNAANKLDEIILDKGIELNDLIIIIKKLIDKKEDFNIIKKILNTNKGALLINHNELFDYAFYKAMDSIELNTPDIYYYIALLKLFYNSKIDKTKYVTKLNNVSDDSNEFANEIYYILHGQKRLLSTKRILDKYGVITDLKTINVKTTNSNDKDDITLTIDSEGSLLRDDALSIQKSGNKYLVGIHIADSTSLVLPDEILDYQAKNNYACTYLPERVLRLLPKNIEKALSLDKENDKKVISLYVLIDNSGEIVDFKITKNTINLSENLSFKEADLLINNYNNELSTKLKYLYEVSCLLGEKNSKKYKYWDKKENDSIDKRVYNFKSDKIISEFMVLYNHLLAKIACESFIPYVYRAHNESYINNLVKKLNVTLNEETKKVLDNIYLASYYSSYPIYHSGLNLNIYSHSSSPLRRYPDLYNQALLHGLYFKDIYYDFDEEYHKALIEYFNQRRSELSLMASEYTRALKLEKRLDTHI